jgi:hypothetical protein
MRRFGFGLVFVGVVGAVIAPAALARPPYAGALHSKYSLAPESKIAQARCGACHVDGSKPAAGWNRYGKDLAVALGKRRASQEEVTAALGKIENETVRDEKYLDRIKADKLPAGE